MRRVHFAATYLKDAIPEDVLACALRELATGRASFTEMREAGFLDVLQTMLLPMHRIDEIAATHVQLPSGRRARIDYHDGRPPSVASRLQDFFFHYSDRPLAQRVTSDLVNELVDLSRNSSAERGSFNLGILDPASMPETPISPSPQPLAIIGLLGGLIVGLSLALVRPRLNPS